MYLKTTILAAATAVLFAASAHAQGAGRSLDIQPGARENGMGAAGVALGDEATGATWWNPAALGFIQHPAVQLTYAQLVPGLANDVNYNYGTWVQPVEGWGAFGVDLVFLNYGQSERTGPGGEALGTFNSYEISPAISYGTRILPDFAVGANLKYIHVQLAPQADRGVGNTFGIDLAGLYRIPAVRLRVGVNVQNLGPSITFINEDQASPLSRNVKTGFAWDPWTQKTFGATIAADFNQSLVSNDFRTYHGGLELRYGGGEAGKGMGDIGLAGRIGYYSDPTGDIKDVTYGIGINWARIGLDYGSIPQATGLPNVNKITLGYRF